jgi:hypothetical protein
MNGLSIHPLGVDLQSCISFESFRAFRGRNEFSGFNGMLFIVNIKKPPASVDTGGFLQSIYQVSRQGR